MEPNYSLADSGPELHAVIVEAGDRDKNVTRNIQEYISIRRGTIGAQSAFAICEFDLNLVDEVYYHPAVTELIDCVAELMLIDNVSLQPKLLHKHFH